MAHRNLVITILAGIATASLAAIGIKKTLYDGRHEYKQLFSSPLRIESNGNVVHVIPHLIVIEKSEVKSANFPPSLTDDLKAFESAVLRTIKKFEKQIVLFKHRGEEDKIFDHKSLHALLNGNVRVELREFDSLQFFMRLKYVDPIEDAA